MKKFYITIAILLILIIGFFFFRSRSSSRGAIKIGVSTLLSGDFASLGENIVNSARLAVDEINNKGGVNGRRIELVIQDAGVDSKTGLAAAEKLINVDGVNYIVGGTSSNGTLAAASLVNEKKVIYMTPVTGGANVDNAGEYVFRIANSDLLAGRDIARAMLKMGLRNVAVVAEVTEYTLDIKKSFEETIMQGGGKLVFSDTFQPNTSDFRTMLLRVKEVHSEAMLILSQTGTSGAYFIKQLRQMGIPTKLFSDFTLVTNENAKKVAGNFEGIYFADPAYDAENPQLLQFFADYKSRYGYAPTIPFHAAATYDSIHLLTDAITAVGDDSSAVHDWLIKKVQDYHGFMGTYSLDEKGNSDLGFTIRVVKGDQFIPAQ